MHHTPLTSLRDDLQTIDTKLVDFLDGCTNVLDLQPIKDALGHIIASVVQGQKPPETNPAIADALYRLLCERMSIVAQVARYKNEHSIAIRQSSIRSNKLVILKEQSTQHKDIASACHAMRDEFWDSVHQASCDLQKQLCKPILSFSLPSPAPYRAQYWLPIIAAAQKESGNDVISLGIGDPGFSMDYSLEALQASEIRGYPRQHNIYRLVQQLILDTYPTGHKKDNLCLLPGSKVMMSLLPQMMRQYPAIFGPNPSILVPHPTYPAYVSGASTYGIAMHFYTLDRSSGGDWVDSLIATHQAHNNNHRQFARVNFPNNPSGQLATLTQWEKLLAYASQHKLFIVKDSAYEYIVYDGKTAPAIWSISGASDHVLELNTLSKSHSAAGVRFGWCLGREDIIQACQTALGIRNSGIPTPTMKAALQILQTPWDKAAMIAHYQSLRDRLCAMLSPLGLHIDQAPAGGFYVRARIVDSSVNAEAFVKNLLHQHQIFVTPGSIFGDETSRYVRLSFGSLTHELIDEMQHRLAS